ncbi:MAG: helix-turn-helix transcriptional regulator [Ruminococcaceae bacterium]|nr:helix-turn-helix transcriptional regulator [Oscillospiraceae bacterium]
MNIGEKIKRLRLSKLMTQADLAGSQITRNMLSSIEHGTALPSLPTAIYIARRLNVPVGYLLAEEDNEFSYRKMANIGNIRRAFAEKDYAGCLSLLAALGEEKDDELSLIRAECEYGVAQDAFEKGRLRFAVAALDRAYQATTQTVYQTAWLRERIAVCFRYLSGLSGTLVSDVLDVEETENAKALGDFLVEYVLALEALEGGQAEMAMAYMRRYPTSLYAQRLSALLLMKKEDYVGAQAALESLLARDELTFGVLLYEVFGDLECCYRKNDDYKRAYEFSGSRLGILERLLEEI